MEARVPYKDVDALWAYLKEWHLPSVSMEFGRHADELIKQFDGLVAWYQKATASAALDPEQFAPQPEGYWLDMPVMVAHVFTRMDETLRAIGQQPPDGFHITSLKLAMYIALTAGREADSEFHRYQAVAAAQPNLQDLIEELAETVPLDYPDDRRREEAPKANRIIAEAYRAESAREGVVPVAFQRLAIRYALMVAEREGQTKRLYIDWRRLIAQAAQEGALAAEEWASDETDRVIG